MAKSTFLNNISEQTCATITTKILVFFVVLFNISTLHAFSIVVFGDLNGGGCDRNDRVNRIVQKMNAETGIDFFISTGDIIDGFPDNNGDITSCFATDPFTINGL